MNPIDERQSMLNRARRSVRDIALALALTVAALLFLGATFHAHHPSTDAHNQPGAASNPNETGSVVP